jgi:thymidylate synthase
MEYQYLRLLEDVLIRGEEHDSRAGKTYSIFGGSVLKHNMENGECAPILTTRKIYWKTGLRELLWFLSGSMDIRDLWEKKCHIWDANHASESWSNNPHRLDEFDVGLGYGAAWRNFNNVDQLYELIKGIKEDPYSRRHVVSLWNPANIGKSCLDPCHIVYHFKVNKNHTIDLTMFQRSADLYLGTPTNIVGCMFLLKMVAHHFSLYARNITIMMSDAHIYESHISQVLTQIRRDPYTPPKLYCDAQFGTQILDFCEADFRVSDYQHHPELPGVMSV